MDVRGGGGASVGGHGSGSSTTIDLIHGSIHSMVASSLLLLLIVSLVAAIHLASGCITSRRRRKETERGRSGVVGSEGEERNYNDSIMEFMQCLMLAAEEDFVEKMVKTCDDNFAGGARKPMLAPAPSSREALVQETEQEGEEREPWLPLALLFKQEAKEGEERQGEAPAVLEAATAAIVTRAHRYRFLAERGLRGFVKEPEAMTVLVQESFAVAPEPSSFNTSKGVSGATSSASELSCFEASDSESSLSDGYSVNELAADSDSDCFRLEKDFPAAHALDAVSLGSSISVTDHSDEVASDAEGSPEISKKELVSSTNTSYKFVPGAKGSPEPSEKELVGTNDHLFGFNTDNKTDFVSTNDKPYAIASDVKRSPEPSEQELVDTNGQSCVLDSVTKNRSKPIAEEQVSRSNHSDDATRQAKISDTSVTEKEDAEDEEECDSEDNRKDVTAEEEDDDDDDDDELELLWEHQDLIEQLKMELKQAQAFGLPTILEESETPTSAMEDLKPWKISAKFLREDPTHELNKFSKSYNERMRKLDMLCYQKMYALDFLQLRSSLQYSTSSHKTLFPSVTSVLSHNFRSSHRRCLDDPSERFLKELRCDLETVYVGQMCLSWEFLRWQYEQARDLPESDPYHGHQYNQVAGEFQQFQVVVQRFIEGEAFQGPRLLNYVNNRCVLRSLLQVPVVREDKSKDQLKGNYGVSSNELEGVMEESMRVLWEFIKADKVETTVLKGLPSLQDPSEHEFMMQIHAMLQKKEKRLKDLLRTGNCIVRKFKKPREAGGSNRSLFFSQVDMRLVSRVLKMPRITSDQLQWCHAKLDKITLAERKIHREPSFLLFPC